jgi:L1 cell adhesion molecule like protein
MVHSIGIDLGTTFSCVASWDMNRPEVLDNQQSGKLTTPSKVAFTDKQQLVGVAADNQSLLDPKNCIFCSKRLIGRLFSDRDLQKDLISWPFVVVAGEDNRPQFQVTHMGQVKRYTPEEISSFILQKMREIACIKFSEDIRDAVITVPAYFTYAQRKATEDAGTIAGLNVLRVINEPTAAALAYGFHVEFQQPQIVLVYDFGGGTFDVSILRIHRSSFKVLGTGGNTRLGGEDIDNEFVNFIVDDLLKKRNLDVSKDERALLKIRRTCIEVKEILSTADSTEYILDFQAKDVYRKEITAARLGRIIDPLVDVTMSIVTEVMGKASIKAERVDHVLLVGGSSRLRKVHQKLAKMFGEAKIKNRMHPEQVVAQGASILAAILTGEIQDVDPVRLEDVTPLTLGVESDGGQFTACPPMHSLTCDSP